MWKKPNISKIISRFFIGCATILVNIFIKCHALPWRHKFLFLFLLWEKNFFLCFSFFHFHITSFYRFDKSVKKVRFVISSSHSYFSLLWLLKIIEGHLISSSSSWEVCVQPFNIQHQFLIQFFLSCLLVIIQVSLSQAF
jgi:hypothetical protein